MEEQPIEQPQTEQLVDELVVEEQPQVLCVVLAEAGLIKEDALVPRGAQVRLAKNVADIFAASGDVEIIEEPQA